MLIVSKRPNRWRAIVARLLLRDWARMTAPRTDRTLPEDFGFGTPFGIPPEMIVGFEHPTKIPDPLERRKLSPVERGYNAAAD